MPLLSTRNFQARLLCFASSVCSTPPPRLLHASSPHAAPLVSPAPSLVSAPPRRRRPPRLRSSASRYRFFESSPSLATPPRAPLPLAAPPRAGASPRARRRRHLPWPLLHAPAVLRTSPPGTPPSSADTDAVSESRRSSDAYRSSGASGEAPRMSRSRPAAQPRRVGLAHRLRLGTRRRPPASQTPSVSSGGGLPALITSAAAASHSSCRATLTVHMAQNGCHAATSNQIQNQIYSMPNLSYKVPSVKKRHASLATNYMETSEVVDLDWENLGFGLVETDFMYVAKCGADGNFSKGEVLPFGPIAVSPSAGVLNYGQGLFEGLKAYRKTDGSILLFRPEENATRMITGAERMCMPAPTVEQFIDAINQTVLANKRWVPPTGKGSLYIRPLLMGSGAVLGLAPAPEYTFIVFVSPVGNYFKEGLSPINLIVEDKFHRASPGGTGGVKTIGNYASVLKAQKIAKGKGYSDVLYLDAVHDKYLEEVSSCNIFVVKDNVISTPAIKGTILPGITRKSIIEVAQSKGFKVEERLVSVDELMNADEVFCTGTAVVVSPVGSITYLGKRVEYGNQGVGIVSQQLYKSLTSLQMGVVEDYMGWTVQLNQ